MLKKFVIPMSFIALIVLGAAACNHSNTRIENLSNTTSTVDSPFDVASIFQETQEHFSQDADVDYTEVIPFTTDENLSNTTSTVVPSTTTTTTTTEPLPAVERSRDVVKIGFGYSSKGCVLIRNGELWCWNTWTNDGGSFIAPVRFAIDNVVEATEDLYSGHGGGCVNTSNGELWCWSEGDRDGPNATFTNPYKMPISNVAEISTGSAYARGCARTTGGELWCWEDTNADSRELKKSPINNIAKITSGNSIVHGCVTDTNRELYCWGQLTHELPFKGFIFDIPLKMPINNVVEVEALTPGDGCARTGNGELWCWYETVFEKSPIENVVEIAPSSDFFRGCASNSVGELWCWKLDTSNLSAGTSSAQKVSSVSDIPFDEQLDVIRDKAFENLKKAPIDNVVELSGLDFDGSACTRTREGEIWCWGRQYSLNFDDDNNVADIFVNLKKSPIVGAVNMVGHCARTSNGDLWCWDPRRFETPKKLSLA